MCATSFGVTQAMASQTKQASFLVLVTCFCVHSVISFDTSSFLMEYGLRKATKCGDMCSNWCFSAIVSIGGMVSRCLVHKVQNDAIVIPPSSDIFCYIIHCWSSDSSYVSTENIGQWLSVNWCGLPMIVDYSLIVMLVTSVGTL